MSEANLDLAEKVLARDRRAIAQAITAIENREAKAIPLLKQLFPRAGRARVVGITGSPGTGKSTLVEKLAIEFRRRGVRVGILAVDPTSPFSGGAILGDRVRMQGLANDLGVYIRSMATRGQLGGLAPTTHDAVAVLDAAGYELILIETVGVGQDEVDVARLADVTVLLLVPGMGDDIQTFKAGVMEIADLYVINKADTPGADRIEQEVTAMLTLTSRADGWTPPIIRTVATTGQGMDGFCDALDRFWAISEKPEVRDGRRKQHWRARLLELLRQSLLTRAVEEQLPDGVLDQLVEDVLTHRQDPYSVVEKIIADFTAAGCERASSGSRDTMKFHHLGIAVDSIDAAVPTFARLLGEAPEPTETVADQKVRVAVFRLGNGRLELLEGTSAESSIARFLARRGQGIHHLTLTVPNLREALRKLESDGIRLIDREPRTGAGHELIAFLHPTSTAGVLIELVEES